MKKNMISTLVASLVFFSVNVQAVPIVGLYNTGEGITVDKTTDINYQLTNFSGNSIYGGHGEAVVGSGWPISPWAADNSTSHWLTPTSNRAESFDSSRNSFYLWTLSFDLTGFDPSTASFAGQFSADNNAVAYLNGNIIGLAVGFTQWYSFVATSDLFVAGTNTLEFVVTNIKQSSGNPTGLRAEFTSSDVASVPAPAALPLISVGLLTFAGLKNRFIARK